MTTTILLRNGTVKDATVFPPSTDPTTISANALSRSMCCFHQYP